MNSFCLKIAMSAYIMIGSLSHVHAQEEKTIVMSDSTKTKENGNNYRVYIGSQGFRAATKKQDKKRDKSRFQTYWGMMDFGLNLIHDQTVYGATNQMTNKYGVQEDWFDLRNGRSWNVNIYPVMANFKALRNENFKINIYSGIGLQIYNFRYKSSITHQTDPKDGFTNDANVKLSKNKLSQNFLSVPLMINFNHKIDKRNWLTYGFGASAGYNLNTWTKQQSPQYGKVKNHDLYNFNEFNVNLIGEIGWGDFRFFASYQVTNMYKNIDLKQHPISFGIRFGKI